MARNREEKKSRSTTGIRVALAAGLIAGGLAISAFLARAVPARSAENSARQVSAPVQKAADAARQRSLEVIDADRYVALVAEHRGKPLMVAFWATWCEPCRDEYPMVIELVRQYQPKRLEVFGMNLDDDAEESLALRFMAKTQPVFPNYRKKPGKEEEFINRVNPKWSGALPATFFYSPDGHLAGQLVGEHSREEFVSAIEKLLSTRSPK
jgi:thiol-disulfide isomerase/thioredoxin